MIKELIHVNLRIIVCARLDLTRWRNIFWLLASLTSTTLLAVSPAASVPENLPAVNGANNKSAQVPTPSPLYFTNIHSVQAQYDVLLHGLKVGTMTEHFIRNQNAYHIENHSVATGFAALLKPEKVHTVSTGIVTANGLRPTTYSQTRKLDSRRNAYADFNWDALTVTLKDKSGILTVPLPAGTQDRLSAMYQFLHISLKEATTRTFSMTNGNKITDYVYNITPNQSVTTPLGTFAATYLSSLPQSNSRRSEIWIVPEHENFPYKMILTDSDGEKITQVLTKLKITPH
ncbi:MAG: DUF3108 domain-containing protein [Candidatus Nitrotoga sp.]